MICIYSISTDTKVASHLVNFSVCRAKMNKSAAWTLGGASSRLDPELSSDRPY